MNATRNYPKVKISVPVTRLTDVVVITAAVNGRSLSIRVRPEAF
ncbi:hypothetical protein [Devosia chinhatensis]|nr:hypothetical protein [Devosia chinhatensis]